MLIISHTDGNHTDTVTFPIKHAKIYEMFFFLSKSLFVQKADR